MHRFKFLLGGSSSSVLYRRLGVTVIATASLLLGVWLCHSVTNDNLRFNITTVEDIPKEVQRVADLLPYDASERLRQAAKALVLVETSDKAPGWDKRLIRLFHRKSPLEIVEAYENLDYQKRLELDRAMNVSSPQL